jgi:hypothetical protein
MSGRVVLSLRPGRRMSADRKFLNSLNYDLAREQESHARSDSQQLYHPEDFKDSRNTLAHREYLSGVI